MPQDSSTARGPPRIVRTLLYGVIGAFLIILIGFLILGILAIEAGDMRIAGTYAEFIGGTGMAALILLTGWYAYQTKRMANQQWMTHREEIEDRRLQRKMEVEALRRALYEEIGKIDYLDDLAMEDYTPNHSTLLPIVPRTVYEENASKIGLLTEKEVDLVVEFYTRASDVEKYMKVQKREDASPASNMLKEIERLGRLPTNLMLKILTLGKYTADREIRTENIREKIAELSDTQSRAKEELKKNLPEGSDRRD
jgi:hypothetical protein